MYFLSSCAGQLLLTAVWCLPIVQIGFAAADAVTGLKLIEAGVPKENLALLAIPMVPIQVLLPWFISRYTAGKMTMCLCNHVCVHVLFTVSNYSSVKCKDICLSNPNWACKLFTLA